MPAHSQHRRLQPDKSERRNSCACHQVRSFVPALPACSWRAARKNRNRGAPGGAPCPGRRRHATQARTGGSGRRPHRGALRQPGRLRSRRAADLARCRHRLRRHEGREARGAQRHRLPEQGDRRRGRPRHRQGDPHPGGRPGGTRPHPRRQGLHAAVRLRRIAEVAAERRSGRAGGRSEIFASPRTSSTTPSCLPRTMASSPRPARTRGRSWRQGRWWSRSRAMPSARRSSPSPARMSRVRRSACRSRYGCRRNPKWRSPAPSARSRRWPTAPRAPTR